MYVVEIDHLSSSWLILSGSNTLLIALFEATGRKSRNPLLLSWPKAASKSHLPLHFPLSR